MDSVKVSSVIVTFNPNILRLQLVVESASCQVDKTYIVDNSYDTGWRSQLVLPSNAEIIDANGNCGIAKGFNLGIQAAKKSGMRYVILLDQDSIVPVGIISKYLALTSFLTEQRKRIAAIGPRYRNIKSGAISRFVRYGWFRNRYIGSDDLRCPAVICADFLISSGSFIDITVFDVVGLMDEDLFIDHVDTEWCMRAKRKGYDCYGAWNAIIDHELGVREFKFWLLRWRRQPIHNPFRVYYVFRNSILMYRMKHVPIKWISGDLFRLMRLFIIYIFFVERKKESLNWMLRGIYDGVRGISGAAPTKIWHSQ